MTGGGSPAAGEAAVVWSPPTVAVEDRAGLLGHGAVTVWLTGLPGSGKSTLAHTAAALLNQQGVLAYVLDGDNLRFGLNSDLGFSPEDRAENIRRAGEVAALLRDAGAVVLASFVSPYRRDRDQVRSLHPPGSFLEVFVDAPLAICEQRDPKGLYARARAGAVAEVTGISAPYEAPTDPELRVDTSAIDAESASAAVVAEVLSRVRPSGGGAGGHVG